MGGTLESSILVGCPIINHPAIGNPHLWKPPYIVPNYNYYIHSHIFTVLDPTFSVPFQENVKYLPGITLPEHVKAEPDLKKAWQAVGFPSVNSW